MKKSKFSIIWKIILSVALVAMLADIAQYIWYINSDFRYEEELMDYVSDYGPTHGMYVGGDDEDFVISYPYMNSDDEIREIISLYNEYVTKYSEQYKKRFNSITLQFFYSSFEEGKEPDLVVVGTRDKMTIG